MHLINFSVNQRAEIGNPASPFLPTPLLVVDGSTLDFQVTFGGIIELPTEVRTIYCIIGGVSDVKGDTGLFAQQYITTSTVETGHAATTNFDFSIDKSDLLKSRAGLFDISINLTWTGQDISADGTITDNPKGHIQTFLQTRLKVVQA